MQLICAFVFTYAKSMFSHNAAHMSNIIRKPAFCKCENKDADQLCGNRAADQRLCFHYIDLLIEKVEGLYYDDNSTIPLLSQPLIICFGCISPKADLKKRFVYLMIIKGSFCLFHHKNLLWVLIPIASARQF